jgi:hypothetical protein
MELVPPKRGQRHKSTVLPHFNKAMVFQLVEVYENGIFKDFAVIDFEKSCPNQYYIWFQFDLISQPVETDQIRAIQIPYPPKHAIDSFTTTIGGIGKHIRWKVVLAKKHFSGNCKLFVSKIMDKTKFENFVEEQIKPFGFCTYEYQEYEESVSTTIDIPCHKDITYVAAAFHCANYIAVPLNDDMSSCGNIGIERYDRSEHTWWNQDQKNAGPLRDTHKWKYNFIPPYWKHLPFTWFSLADNVDLPINKVAELPLPLRDYVCQKMKREVHADKDFKLLSSMQTKDRTVTSRLTYDQNIQLLNCAYWTFVAPFDKKIVKLASMVQFRYLLHGYIGREMGGYTQSAKYIGHGAYCRSFKNKPQYDYDKLDNTIKNKIKKQNGIVFGNGFKGTRGKYGHNEFPTYQPKKKMKRSVQAELEMREIPSNKFEDYKTQI